MRPAEIYKRHDLMTYISQSTDLGQIIKVKIFVQGRILSSTNGSKLIFHMRMYLYMTSMTIQDPLPIFHSLLTSDFGQFSMVNTTMENWPK